MSTDNKTNAPSVTNVPVLISFYQSKALCPALEEEQKQHLIDYYFRNREDAAKALVAYFKKLGYGNGGFNDLGCWHGAQCKKCYGTGKRRIRYVYAGPSFTFDACIAILDQGYEEFTDFSLRVNHITESVDENKYCTEIGDTVMNQLYG